MMFSTATTSNDTIPVGGGTMETSPRWVEIVSVKRQDREAAIKSWDQNYGKRAQPSSTNVKSWPLTSGELTQRQIIITEEAPSQLLHHLASGEYTAEETLRAFIARTVIAHHLTNPLTEVFFDQGLEKVKELDRHMQVHHKPVGPFHGLPISLKDVMNVHDKDTTMGYVAWIGKKPKRPDTLVDLLLQGGAVFYCKTNVPQTLMSGECFNYVFGRTCSPCNTTTSAGGSSGGEGSLVALGGSPIGVGTDIGGSINTPANHNGVYGLCPSTRRLPIHGAHNTFENLVVIAVAGPLSRTIDGLEVYVKGVLDLCPWNMDASCVEMPWRQSEYELALGLDRKLCFGFIYDDGVVTPHPPIQRGMRETAAALTAAGHHVIEMPSFLETVGDSFEGSLLAVFRALGGHDIRRVISEHDEPLSQEIVLPKPEHLFSLGEYFEAAKCILTLRQKYLQKYMNTTLASPTGRPVDVFILPSGGHVSPPHGTMGYLLYEAISNLLDWTCATIPVGFVDQELDRRNPDEKFVPLSDQDLENWAAYSPELCKDVPVCLQVLGQRHTEEKVLGALRAINRALGRGQYTKA